MKYLHDGILLEKDGEKMLKAYLEIKRQLKYVESQYKEVKEKYPENKQAQASWHSMAAAYDIALQILEGKEL